MGISEGVDTCLSVPAPPVLLSLSLLKGWKDSCFVPLSWSSLSPYSSHPLSVILRDWEDIDSPISSSPPSSLSSLLFLPGLQLPSLLLSHPSSLSVLTLLSCLSPMSSSSSHLLCFLLSCTPLFMVLSTLLSPLLSPPLSLFVFEAWVPFVPVRISQERQNLHPIIHVLCSPSPMSCFVPGYLGGGGWHDHWPQQWNCAPEPRFLSLGCSQCHKNVNISMKSHLPCSHWLFLQTTRNKHQSPWLPEQPFWWRIKTLFVESGSELHAENIKTKCRQITQGLLWQLINPPFYDTFAAQWKVNLCL